MLKGQRVTFLKINEECEVADIERVTEKGKLEENCQRSGKRELQV